MNQQIWAHFDNGMIAEAIVGEGRFFLMDHTWRDNHATTLVLGQLIEWAHERGRLSDAGAGLLGAVRHCAAQGKPKDCFMIAWAYIIKARAPDFESNVTLNAANPIAVDVDGLADTLQRVLDHLPAGLREDPQFFFLVERVAGGVPMLRIPARTADKGMKS